LGDVTRCISSFVRKRSGRLERIRMTDHKPLSYSIAEARSVTGLGRTTLYEAIRSGKLRARKHGRRTLILRSDLADWLATLPTVKAA
jgi:excisionase family DNA binding protein